MSRTTTLDLAPATISEADGVRYLHLGTPWVQGAMRIRKSLALELEYIQRMMVWMLMRPSAELTRGHAVQLGLGAAARRTSGCCLLWPPAKRLLVLSASAALITPSSSSASSSGRHSRRPARIALAALAAARAGEAVFTAGAR